MDVKREIMKIMNHASTVYKTASTGLDSTKRAMKVLVAGRGAI